MSHSGRKRQKDTLNCDTCSLVFDCKDNLNKHMKSMHDRNSDTLSTTSPCSSPPRKKLEILNESNNEIEKMNTNDTLVNNETENVIGQEHDLVIKLNARIRSLESSVQSLAVRNDQDGELKAILYQQMEKFRLQNDEETCRKTLFDVKEAHVSSLNGFKSYMKIVGNGACLENCTAMHLFKDQALGVKVKRIVNDHMVSNLDYYSNMIQYPYKEFIFAEQDYIVINTPDELKDFLQSDRSLTVYSNDQEILAIANLFNIRISIFSYNGESGYWNHVYPDPAFGACRDKETWAPNMSLYHNKNTHYDLLIENMTKTNNSDDHSKYCQLCDKVFQTAAELTSHLDAHNTLTFACETCDLSYKQRLDLEMHMIEIHEENNLLFACETCDLSYKKKLDLEMHMIDVHEEKKLREWTCNDCYLQYETSEELRIHLKHTSHQPSPNVGNTKDVFIDYMKCYTCDLEFEGSRNLMAHRKSSHPSKKKCKNFPSNCVFGTDCLYIHEEDMMDLDESLQNEAMSKCHVCKIDFPSKDAFMLHKKDKHGASVANCRKFRSKECTRDSKSCWFHHRPEQSGSQTAVNAQVFQKDNKEAAPPDQMSKLQIMISTLCQKVETLQMDVNAMKNHN